MTKKINLYPEVISYAEHTSKEFDKISKERKNKLDEISKYVESKLADDKIAKLTFICTHNSRRSHISQVWAQAAALYYGIQNVETYSGGTEATAFFPSAVKAVRKAGFKAEKKSDDNNPIYNISLSENFSLKAFSKKYSDDFNPQEGYCAVMTCSDADEACPVVFGADARISIPFEDPKKFDGTDLEEIKYDERCRQISREMLYVFSLVKKG